MPSRKDTGDDTRAPGVSADRLPPAPLVFDDAPVEPAKASTKKTSEPAVEAAPASQPSDAPGHTAEP